MATEEYEDPKDACYRHIVAGEAAMKSAARKQPAANVYASLQRARVHLDYARWYDHMAFMATVEGSDDEAVPGD